MSAPAALRDDAPVSEAHSSATTGGTSSPTTERSVAFVTARRATADAIGRGLAEHIADPDAFADALRAGLIALSDPAYVAEQQRVAPGLGPVHGVRGPLLAALSRGFQLETRHDRTTPILFLVDRLFREPELEAHWFAFDLLDRTLDAEPERTWQLMRRAARVAGDWITVDSLAHPYARGIRAEPYRWAELEQLVFSPSRWERRLVGSTIATMSHGRRRRSEDARSAIVEQGLPLLGQLIGDADPDVQKSLSWAYRSLAQLDGPRTEAALVQQADLAVAGDDGLRAWVIRDSLSKLDPTVATDLRTRLVGIRRRPGAASTSAAAALAARFGALPDPNHHPEPPLI
jgi:3-methyladenine DNA glycosylase AlkD